MVQSKEEKNAKARAKRAKEREAKQLTEMTMDVIESLQAPRPNVAHSPGAALNMLYNHIMHNSVPVSVTQMPNGQMSMHIPTPAEQRLARRKRVEETEW